MGAAEGVVAESVAWSRRQLHPRSSCGGCRLTPGVGARDRGEACQDRAVFLSQKLRAAVRQTQLSGARLAYVAINVEMTRKPCHDETSGPAISAKIVKGCDG